LEEDPKAWRAFEEWRDGRLEERGLQAAHHHLELALIPQRDTAAHRRSDFDFIDKPSQEEATEGLEGWGILPNRRHSILGG